MNNLSEYRNLWDKYLDNIEKLNDSERKEFCRFMNHAAKPQLLSISVEPQASDQSLLTSLLNKITPEEQGKTDQQMMDKLLQKLLNQISVYSGKRHAGLSSLQDMVHKLMDGKPIICECCGNRIDNGVRHRGDCMIIKKYAEVFHEQENETLSPSSQNTDHE
jgi:hypothetical protein